MAQGLSVHVLTWNSLEFLQPCLDGILRQSLPPERTLFIDCGSEDGTVEWLRRAAGRHPQLEILLLNENRGYAGGHNAGLAANDCPLVLLLNPDVRLGPNYIRELQAAMERHPQAGAASGKLWRGHPDLTPLEGPVLDSTGIIMTRNQRHFDRGAGHADSGQHDREEEVFGVSGAAPLYRRSMLEDIRVAGEIFDESFFSYREDVDLAWRARLLGWSAVYVPSATAVHRRRVRPENRHMLPAILNRHSVKNRFLLRLKNQTASNLRHTWLPALLRDTGVIGYMLLREWSSLPALAEVLRLWPRTWRKRRQIMSRRRACDRDVDRWFGPPWPSLPQRERPRGTAGA